MRVYSAREIPTSEAHERRRYGNGDSREAYEMIMRGPQRPKNYKSSTRNTRDDHESLTCEPREAQDRFRMFLQNAYKKARSLRRDVEDGRLFLWSRIRISHESHENRSRELRESVTRALRIGHERCENRPRERLESVTRAARSDHESSEKLQ